MTTLILKEDCPYWPKALLSPEEKTTFLEEQKQWKKGPFWIGDFFLEGDWDCRFKWKRMLPFLEQLPKSSHLLDIGANNGFFSFRLKADPVLKTKCETITLLDPVPVFFKQFSKLFSFCSLTESPSMKYERAGLDSLASCCKKFDCILFMGILYHQKYPEKQLELLKNCLSPKGFILLETLALEDARPVALYPTQFWGMKNISAIPSKSCLEHWIKKSGLRLLQWGEDSYTDLAEQKSLIYHLPTHTSEKTQRPLRIMAQIVHL